MINLVAMHRLASMCLVFCVASGCNPAPNLAGDYRDRSQLFRIRDDNGQISVENWDMRSGKSGPVVVVPLVWKDKAYRGSAQLIGELSVAKSDTGILVLGAGNRWEATPFALPQAMPGKDEAATATELVAALRSELDTRIATGKCGDRKMVPERLALLNAWFATLKPTKVDITKTVETPFLVHRNINVEFAVPAFSGAEGNVSQLGFSIQGKDSIGIIKDLGVDTATALESINDKHRPWGNLGDMFCDDFFFSRKAGAAKYTNEPAPKPAPSWFR